MEFTLDTLESQLTSVRNDLAYVAQRLDVDFARAFDQAGKQHLHPRRLLARLGALQAAVPGVAADVASVTKARTALVEAASTALLSNRAALRVLEQRAGVRVAEDVQGEQTRQCQAVQTLLRDYADATRGKANLDGAQMSERALRELSINTAAASAAVPVLRHQEDAPDVPSMPGTPVSSSVSTPRGSLRSASFASPPASPARPPASPAGSENLMPPMPPTPAVTRSLPLQRSATQYVPVCEEEFASVSSLVRLRCKLTDVNKVYDAIFRHFNRYDRKHSAWKKALTIPELAKNGVKVVGQTGQSKLGTLRALRIIEITKQGILLAP